MTEPVTSEAHRLVTGPRQASYDHPATDFAVTGRMWGALLERWRHSEEPDVPPELVGLCMAALKLARETYRPARDNRVDACGYVETVDMIHARRAAPPPV